MPHIHELIDYAADVFVVHKDKVLLRMHDKYKMWLAPGGHIELNEDPVEAAIREVKEEVGLEIKLVGEVPSISDGNVGYKELIPPRFMNRHPIKGVHEHISLVYFATSDTDAVVPEEAGDMSNEWHWFTEEELEINTHGVPGNIRHYALTALKELA